MLIAALTVTASVLIDVAATPLARWAGVASELPDRITARFLLAVLIFAPISEELLFRAEMRQPLYTVVVGPGLILLLAAPWVMATFVVAAAWVSLALPVYGLLMWRRSERPIARFASSRRFVRHFSWVLWALTLAFALVHVGNYS